MKESSQRSVVTVITLVIAVVITLGGCGMPGEDGDSYIAYSWAVGPIYFYTEDPAFANSEYITNGKYLPAAEGSWYMEYLAWDNSAWWAEYEIYVEEGEEGDLFTDGEDGEDLYFELACYSFGATFNVWGSPTASAADIPLAQLGAQGETAGELSASAAPAGPGSSAEVQLSSLSSPVPAAERAAAPWQYLQTNRYTVALRYGQRD